MIENARSAQLEEERAAIIAVIKKEITAWLRGDVNGWAECWVQDERAQHINARPSAGARTLQGFDNIHGYLAPRMGRIDTHAVRLDEVRTENWRFSVGADIAWVTFDQIVPVDASPDAAPGRHNQLRILEKDSGSWKIVAVFHIPNRIGYYKSPWVRVDRNSRIIESGVGAVDLLRHHDTLHIVGQRLCGWRRADNDKLKNAITEADDLIRQRIGRRPIPLVLSGPNDLSISLCWITISDMMIVILLGDDQLLTQAISRAGEAYRLSPAQMRVAEQIAKGNNLNTAAENLRIQPNTVRTHVGRMFERVGVNSQPALIRVLLTVDAPL